MSWYPRSFLIMVLILLAANSLNPVFADSSESGQKQTPERAEGRYRIQSINKMKDVDAFSIEFVAISSESKFSKLMLVSENVSFALRRGEEIRLIGEILKVDGQIAELAQVEIFLPHSQGEIPIWMNSKNSPHLQLRGSRLLEMHAPVTDYLVF